MPDDVIPAWVAEMDYAVDPVVLEAVQRVLADGITGYPLEHDPELAEAYAGWVGAALRLGARPRGGPPGRGRDGGVRLAIDVLSGPGGVVFPTPGYNAQHGLAGITGRAEHLLEVPASAERAEIDLDRLDRLLADGAQTLILTQPHNPWGRVFTRAELEGIRDVVVRHGARVVSDEIHAPLVLPGAEHVSYLAIDGTHDHAVAVVAASKAFNTAGLKCAQLVVPSAADRARLDDRADVAQRLLVAARRGRRARGVRPRRRRGSPRSSSASTSSARCSASCWPSTCPRCGCARSRRRTSPGSTPPPTATTTPPRSRSSAAG